VTDAHTIGVSGALSRRGRGRQFGDSSAVHLYRREFYDYSGGPRFAQTLDTVAFMSTL